MNNIYAAKQYIRIRPERQQAYFKFLADNAGLNQENLSRRFLNAELIQSRCLHFKVNP